MHNGEVTGIDSAKQMREGDETKYTAGESIRNLTMGEAGQVSELAMAKPLGMSSDLRRFASPPISGAATAWP